MQNEVISHCTKCVRGQVLPSNVPVQQGAWENFWNLPGLTEVSTTVELERFMREAYLGRYDGVSENHLVSLMFDLNCGCIVVRTQSNRFPRRRRLGSCIFNSLLHMNVLAFAYQNVQLSICSDATAQQSTQVLKRKEPAPSEKTNILNLTELSNRFFFNFRELSISSREHDMNNEHSGSREGLS